MTTLIREATPTDASRLADLRYEFRSALRTSVEEKEVFVQRCSAWMSSRLSTNWKCWVATSDGEIVGQVWLQLIEKLPNPNSVSELHAYVTNLYVKPEFRGGVGSRLLGCALEWAKQRAVDAVILWPTPPSRTLYMRHGFKEPKDILEIRAKRGEP